MNKRRENCFSVWNLVFVWSAAFLCVSASARAGASAQTGVPLIFIHGLKGSVLADDQGRVSWVNAWEALGLWTRQLQLPLAWEGDTQKKDGLRPTEVLSDVMIFPPWIGEKVYGPWMAAAKNMGAPFYPFAYDWRRDNFESLAEFEMFVEKVRAENHVDQVDVVGHSMGGLLEMALMLKRPDLFRKVFFVGTPFRGGLGFLPDMHSGSKTGLNGRILAPRVLFSFPSVYALFSETQITTLNKQMHPEPVDFFRATDWRDKGLGVFALPKRDRDRDMKFLTIALDHARRFRELLHAKPPQHQPEMHIILGWKFPTLEMAVHGGPKSVRGWDFETAKKIPGDGRVGSNNLPTGDFKFKTFYSAKDHGNLLNDPEVIGYIQNNIKETATPDK